MSCRVAIIDDRFEAYREEQEVLGSIASIDVTRSSDLEEIMAFVRDADAVIVNLESAGTIECNACEDKSIQATL